VQQPLERLASEIERWKSRNELDDERPHQRVGGIGEGRRIDEPARTERCGPIGVLPVEPFRAQPEQQHIHGIACGRCGGGMAEGPRIVGVGDDESSRHPGRRATH
jgi:hypothetical protein